MSIGLNAGKASFVTAVAHSPYDSLRDLIKALSALLKGESSITVKWNCEPEEYDFELRQNAPEAELNIIRYSNHSRSENRREMVFSHKAPAAGICESFWTALEELRKDKDVDEFDKNWRREFPESEMREFTEQLRAVKDVQPLG